MNDSIIEKLEEEIGNEPYGKFIIDKAISSDYPITDTLHEFIAIVNIYNRRHRNANKKALETPIDTKIEITKKIIEAIKKYNDSH